MTRRIQTLLVLLTAPFACVDDGDSAPNDVAGLEDLEEGTIVVETPVLAMVELPSGHTLYFQDGVAATEGGTVWLSESVPGGAAPITRGARKMGATSLEIFMTVAPDLTPDEDLWISHQRESARAGRDGEPPREFDLADFYLPAPRTNNCDTTTHFLTWWQNLAGPGYTTYYSNVLSTTNLPFEPATEIGYFSEHAGCNGSGGTKKFRSCTYAWPILLCSSWTNVSSPNTFYEENTCGACRMSSQVDFNGAGGWARLIQDIDW